MKYILVGKPEENRALEVTRHRWEGSINTDLK
jgi:hypothetical protein